MKIVALLLLGLTAALAYPSLEVPTENGWYMPELDGSFKWMSEETLQSLARQQARSVRAGTNVRYFLYTSSNPSSPQEINPSDAASLKNSNFNKANPTRIIVHGWQNNAESDVNAILRSAYLAVGKYNVICVDWSDKAETINYPAAVLRVSGVGKQVANFIDFLYKEGGMSFATLHLNGHSLGAHVCGYAGKNVKWGRVQQITGLDPALPGFSFDKPSDRLNQNDAAYVESIQTCGGLLGFLEPIGRGAFYPNGGQVQPGCGLDLTGSCAHSRSYEYLAEAVRKNDFPTMKCGEWQQAVNKACGGTYSSVRMGAASNQVNALGDFYVPVNSRTPFGKG